VVGCHSSWLVGQSTRVGLGEGSESIAIVAVVGGVEVVV